MGMYTRIASAGGSLLNMLGARGVLSALAAAGALTSSTAAAAGLALQPSVSQASRLL